VTANQAREILYARMLAAWAPPTSTPAVVFGNEGFDSTGVAEYARMIVRHTDGGQETLGGPGLRKFLRRGLVLVQLYVAADRGLQRMDALQQSLLDDVFEAQTLSQVYLHDGVYRELGPEDGYERGTVTVQFFYEDQK